MTVLPTFFPRSHKAFQDRAVERIFTVEHDERVSGWCHFHENSQQRFTAILVHGLEGSSSSSTILGLAEKCFNKGLNVVRLNLRNCGDTMHLTSTLYSAGLSGDILAVAKELAAEGHSNILLGGLSLGGNIVLNAAAQAAPCHSVRAVVAISPSIDLARCVRAIEEPKNWFYQYWFLRTLKKKIVKKAFSHPHLYDVSKLKRVRTMRQFDHTFTAPAGGYGTSDNYYFSASAKRSLVALTIPSLIITSQDDPLVPFDSFTGDWLSNRNITLIATTHGGHGGFYSASPEAEPGADRYWAENRVVDFFSNVVSG